MYKKFFAVIAVALALATVANADSTSTIFTIDKSLSPAARKWSFTVPAFAIEQQVRLSLLARIDWPSLAGSNPWMKVQINGNYLTKDELLNKTYNFVANNGRDWNWAKGTSWRVLYSPDYKAAIEQKEEQWGMPDNTQPYRFVWDITAFVKPGKNTLTITNLKVRQDKPTTLVLSNATIEVGKHITAPVDPAALVTPAPTGPLPTYVDQGKQAVPMQLHAAPGVMRLAVAGQKFDISTRTSLPAGKWQEASALDQPASISNGESKTLQWKTPLYSVSRKIEVLDDHVHIFDTITNTTNNLIGVMVANTLHFAAKPKHTEIAGRDTRDRNATEAQPRNPSVFAQWADVGIGLVAEDDIFRVQGTQKINPQESMSLQDDQLGVEPGKPVTLEWSIYPVPHKSTFNGDYWDFVNAVRRNWDVNYTIPGPFDFTMAFHTGIGSHSADWYGKWMHDRALKIVVGGIPKYPNGKHAYGTGILFAPDWVAGEKDWINKAHQDAPDVKALVYFHAQLSTEPDGETKYAADRLHDADGKARSYPGREKLPIYLPTENSVYGKALWGYVHTILDTIGADGMYWDEMPGSLLDYAYDAPWDGHTVIINPATHAITGKRTSVPLLMQPLKLDIIRYVRDHGKYLMGNSQPVTRTMMQQKMVRFVETGTYSRIATTNLECPLGLGNNHQENTQADSARNVREMLMRGATYYGWTYQRDPAPWNFTSVMFPITPEKLGAGFVVGKERIQTAISGKFGFSDGAAADVYVVDVNGARVKNPHVKESTEAGKHLYEIRIPSDQFAVLVKRT